MTLENFFKENNLPLRGHKVVLAVSGGPDSMALTGMFQALRKKVAFPLILAHFDHQLRPDSAQEGKLLGRYCQKQHLLLMEAKWRKDKQPRHGIEAAARAARYAFLLQVARKQKAAYLVTAHQNDDLIENILLKLIRSGNPSEMNSLPAISRRGGLLLLRPLLSYSKKDLLTYDHQHHLPFIEDATNLSDSTLRNRLRHHVVPLLKEENGALGRNALRFCREEDLYQRLANKALQAAGQPQLFLAGSYRLPQARLASFSKAEINYYWRSFIWQTWHKRVNENLGSFRLLAYQGYFYLLPAHLPDQNCRFSVRLDRPFCLQGRQFLLTTHKQSGQLIGHFWSSQKNFQAGNWQPGFKLRLASGGHVKAKKMFAQAGIPGPLRRYCLTIFDVHGQPLWVQETYQDQSWYAHGQRYQVYFLKNAKRS